MAVSLAAVIALARRSEISDFHFLVPIFALYGLGQGLAQPGLINTILGSAGLKPADAGAAAGLFLTIAQSSMALGVAVLGNIFFTALGPVPAHADYVQALSIAFTCNLGLQIVAVLLVVFLPSSAAQRPQ